MPVSPPNRLLENRSVPVPHGIAVPPTQDDRQDNRWKYGIGAAIILLLLLLLLLMLLSFGAGTKTTGTGLSGTDQSGIASSGSNQDGQSSDAAGESESTAAEEGVGEDTAATELTESEDDAGRESGEESESSTITEGAEESGKATAAGELVRRLLGAELEDDTDSQTEDRREREQTGGNTLVKGSATVNFFGATGKGSKFVFVFDRSGSMMGRPLETVKRELVQALEPLKSNHSFNIIAYDDRYDLWKPKLISATKENKADAVRFIESITSRGGTEPRVPLLLAIDQKPEIVFFMTDGEFTLNVDEIAASAKRIKINVVQFSDRLPLLVLQELAKRTGGDFR
jgi:hypothetical protein